MDWKQYESTALTYFFMTDRFENKSKIEAIVLKEIKEMKMGCSFRITVGKLQNQSNPKQPIASHGKMTAVEKVITEILLSMNNPTELASTR